MKTQESQQLIDVEPAFIKRCRSAREALSLCVRMSELSDETVAEKLGISKGYMSKLLNGRAALDGDKRIKLMRICGNRAPLQYEAFVLGISVSSRSPDDILRDAMAVLASRGGANA